MELGATVCTAQSPLCSECPVKDNCNAYNEVQIFKENNKKLLTQGLKVTWLVDMIFIKKLKRIDKLTHF